MRAKLTYANVMATVAVFIALGGGAYAVGVAKNSVGKKQLKKNAVTGAKVKNGSLGLADAGPSMHLGCKAGTAYLQGACMESAGRAPGGVVYDTAAATCSGAGGRIASTAELVTFVRRGGAIVPGNEWAIEPTSAADVSIVGPAGETNQQSRLGTNDFRCVFDPTG